LANGQLEDKKLNFIVMPRYDIDLERLFTQYKKKFKLETVISIGLQVIERLEIMHNCGLIHNDLKPQNMMACYKSNTITLIDFGLTLN
jgi:serine/threonine protein kinase